MCVHPARLLSYLRKKDWAHVPLYTSLAAMPDDVAGDIEKRTEVVDYGVCVEADRFETLGDGCYIPSPLAAGVALAMALDANASQVFLAGFDGFDGMAREYREMQSLLDQAAEAGCQISSLTETHFHVPMASLYGVA